MCSGNPPTNNSAFWRGEALPHWHALVLLQRVVPSLRCTAEVVRSEPRTIRIQGALAAEELLAVVQLIERIHPVVVRRELELVEFGGCLGAHGVVHGRKNRDAAAAEG